mgnify:CR=1 FL=1
MTALLKWWLIFCLSSLGLAISVWFDFHNILYEADVTKLSFLILGIFFISSVWIGNKTYKVQKEEDYDQETSVGWFISEACLALGMIGTVTGFLFMLGMAFQDIDVSDTISLQNALMLMAKGMSTALYTTLIGLISSLIIKIQLVNIEVALRD